ncbi:GNAT family N-acetyltransferase [Segetibacter koreensis]|uniref:GNAT family N-acetyltransferase n=1 Tax=Segetibacter koreensis TaxID=398037 RepID=UPI000374292B|nr:GNAT family N-acetyltransferase [Segetibacter koreensis]
MIIQHKEDGNEGTFFIEQNGEELAEMTYTIEKGKMVIDHTEVDESLRGKDVGFRLVEQGVEYARQEKLKILPICEFADKVLQSTDKFKDML